MLTHELITSLLRIGSIRETEPLFELIVSEAPKLVNAKDCSIFWKNGPWREKWRQDNEDVNLSEAFYRRATYDEKKHLIGKDYYLKGEGLTGWVAEHDKSLRIDNIENQEELKLISEDLKWVDKANGFKKAKDRNRQRAFLAVPVRIKNEVLGVIRIAKTISSKTKFNKENQQLLETFAKNVAIIIERIEEEEQKNLWEELYRSNVSFDKDKFSNYLQLVADKIPKYLSAKACSIFLKTDRDFGGLLILRATTKTGPLESSVGQATYQIGEGLTGWVAKHNKSLRLKDVDNKEELENYGKDLKHTGKHEEYVKAHSSFLAAPINRGSKVFGVIRIAQDSQGRFFTSSDQRFLDYFCTNLAVLVEANSSFQDLQFEKDEALERVKETRTQLTILASKFKSEMHEISNSLTKLVSLDSKVDDYTFTIPEAGNFELMKPLVGYKRDLEKQLDLYPYSKNVFLMMKFRKSNEELGEFIIETLNRYGLKGVRADHKEWNITSNVYNPIAVLYCCKFGIALFDEPEETQAYSPNVAYELGIMQYQGKECLILRHSSLPTIPFDLTKDLHVQYERELQVKNKIEKWVQTITC